MVEVSLAFCVTDARLCHQTLELNQCLRDLVIPRTFLLLRLARDPTFKQNHGYYLIRDLLSSACPLSSEAQAHPYRFSNRILLRGIQNVICRDGSSSNFNNCESCTPLRSMSKHVSVLQSSLFLYKNDAIFKHTVTVPGQPCLDPPDSLLLLFKPLKALFEH
ncbi:hypothetical protein VNO77_03755 [Canavalia gladiata]|uniref:Uncharacterized protein n=1 Tax=Canavalia gladiata TaxID=3824 RepID=A0AAN9MW45_CANGL